MRVYPAAKDPAPLPRAKPIDWTLPPGWTQLPDAGPSQFGRIATIQVAADDPSLALAVNELQGGGSGELLPNLNRWEGQLGLPPTPAAEAAKKARTIEVETHPAHRVDLAGTDVNTSKPTRMLAVVLPEGEKTWSFMLKGPPEKVAAHEAAFDQFIASIRFPGHNHGGSAAADPHAHEGAAPAQTQPADNQSYTLSGFKLPEGWERDPAERQMRFATFYAGTGNDRAEVIVSKFGLNRFGSMLDNVNRWRREVGLPPTDDENKENVQGAEIAGASTLLFDFAAPNGERRSNVAMLVKGGEVWFIKLIGPAKTVADQRANFDAFLQSIQFGVAAGE